METIVSLVPFALVTLVLVVVNYRIAQRKVETASAYALLSLIPFVGWFILVYLLAMTDKAVYDKLDQLLERVNR